MTCRNVKEHFSQIPSLMTCELEDLGRSDTITIIVGGV